ncbi:MAG TPA: M20/M25/M40 family metallo-hydrolase [Lacipirellulaceae bacterium]|nr:M20/M25/M40 family metallo-hydrolase [Lacipirellulaceae bacterium]
MSAVKRAHPISDAGALALVMEMMAIPGRSGEEAAIMDFIRGKLIDGGISSAALSFDNAHRRTPIGGQVGNLLLKLPGTIRGPRRMLAAHVDTVPICIGSRPIRKGTSVVSANKHTGLGADDRSGAAVLLTTAVAISRAKLPHPPLTFLWTIEEEVGLFGARYLQTSKLGKPQLAFNFDGGAAHVLKIGATGGYRMTIDVEGIASHAGNHPEEGVSAIAIASLAIADLVQNGWHGLVVKDGCTGTSNVGIFQGGEATNVVTEHVQLRAEARSHEPKFRQRIVKEIESAFKRAAKAVCNIAGKAGRVKFDGALDYDSFRLRSDDPSVVAASAAIKAERLTPELAITNGGLDANWFTAHGIPTVTLGCGQRNIHTAREQLDIAEFHRARRIALRLATVADCQ